MISPLSKGYSKALYLSQSAFSQQTSDIAYSQADRAGGDTVTISNQGKKAALLGNLASIGDFPSTVEDIMQSLKDDTVKKKVRSIYSKLGISSDAELKISAGSDGKINARGDSQEAEEFADAINSDPELSNTIRRMSANTSLLDAIKKHEKFAKAYEADPEEAVKEFAYLLNDNRQSSVTFTVSNGNISSQITHFYS